MGEDRKEKQPVIEGDLPHNLEAEKNLLASILLDPGVLAIAVEQVRPEDFYNPVYRLIYEAMLNLFRNGKAVEALTVADELQRMGRDKDVGGLDTLILLADAVGTSVNAETYAKIVVDYGLMRRMIQEAREVAALGTTGKLDAKEYLDVAETKILSVRDERAQRTAATIGELASAAAKRIEEQRKAPHHVTGVSTGYPPMDNLILGFQPSDLVILAARPSMGKTSLALNFALNAAVDGKSVLFFSIEMSGDQIATRLISMYSKLMGRGILLSRLRSAALTDEEMENLYMLAESMKELKITVDTSAKPSPMEVRATARRMKHRGGCDMIFIDYLQMMKPLHTSIPREQQIAEISRSLKALAKELNVPVIALSQLNRGPETRPNKRPILADLRESGAIEQDADVIMFLYRDEVYNKETEHPDEAEIIIAKQRNGPTGTVKLRFFKEFTLFVTPAIEMEGMPE